jgi:hypothetical protein
LGFRYHVTVTSHELVDAWFMAPASDHDVRVAPQLPSAEAEMLLCSRQPALLARLAAQLITQHSLSQDGRVQIRQGNGSLLYLWGIFLSVESRRVCEPLPSCLQYGSKLLRLSRSQVLSRPYSQTSQSSSSRCFASTETHQSANMETKTGYYDGATAVRALLRGRVAVIWRSLRGPPQVLPSENG